MDMPTNRAELIAVARDAAVGIRPAIRLIRHLGINAGYNPRPGGWIYDDGRTVAHGWREFADRAARNSEQVGRLLAVALREMEPERREASPAPATGPAVRLSPAIEPAAYNVPDAELLQLLALLDGGVTVTRKLYQARWEARTAMAFPIDPAKLDLAVRAATYYGLAVDTVVSGTSGAGTTYELRAEPIHLERMDGETVCKRRIRRAGRLRLRYTTDPAKVTHDRCAKH